MRSPTHSLKQQVVIMQARQSDKRPSEQVTMRTISAPVISSIDIAEVFYGRQAYEHINTHTLVQAGVKIVQTKLKQIKTCHEQ